MYSQDYIKRMIEQLGEVWTYVIALLARGELPKVYEELDKAYRELVHLDRDLVMQSSEDFLVLSTMLGATVESSRAMALADLLRLEAEVHDRVHQNDERDACLIKALNVLLEVHARVNNKGSPLLLDRIAQLHESCANAQLPALTQWRLFRFFDGRGDYAKAEDALYPLLDEAPAYLEHGLDFYERLQRLPDHALEQGGLPRAEVEAALADLRARE